MYVGTHPHMHACTSSYIPATMLQNIKLVKVYSIASLSILEIEPEESGLEQ